MLTAATPGCRLVPDTGSVTLVAAGTANAYSDIDLAINIKDGRADAVFVTIDELLSGLGELDTAVGQSKVPKGMRGIVDPAKWQGIAYDGTRTTSDFTTIVSAPFAMGGLTP